MLYQALSLTIKQHRKQLFNVDYALILQTEFNCLIVNLILIQYSL